MSDGLSFVAHRLVGPAQVAIGKGRFRVDLKGLVQVGDGAVELSLFVMGSTPVGVGGGIVCVELNGLGEVGDGAVEITRPEMRGPPTEVRDGIIGVGFNCLGVIRDGAVNLLLLIPIPPASVTDREGAKANVSILVSQSQHWQQTMPRCASASMDRSASLIWKMRIMA